MTDNWNSGPNGSDLTAGAWDNGATDNWQDNSAADQYNGEGSTETPEFGDDGTTFRDAGTDGGEKLCNNCQQPGHFARECPEPRADVSCHNCGGPHLKKDCDAPKKKYCHLCNVEGQHDTAACNAPYPLGLDNVPDISESACWELLKQASNDMDLDDFKDGMKTLQKACPEITYPAMEKEFRARGFKFYIVAMKRDVAEGYTIVNLQGEVGQIYTVGIFKSSNCPRPNLIDKWPKNSQENLARLAEAGIPLTKGLSHCRRCNKYGHIAKECSDEHVEIDAPKVVCALCSEEGHRVRDCTQPRHKEREPKTCKRCGKEGHFVKDCEEPEPAMVCRRCNEVGHKAQDCEKVICRNCDAEGHMSKDCTAPKDWSRVKCKHCGETGHASASRCKPGAQKVGTENNAEDDSITIPTSSNLAVAEKDWNDASAHNNASGYNEWEQDTGKNNETWNQGAQSVAQMQW